MQENDPLASSFDFDKIAVDSAREQARRDSVTALGAAFDRSASKTLPITTALSEVMSGVALMGSNMARRMQDASMSEAYDEFTGESGVEIESRIVCMRTRGHLDHLRPSMGGLGAAIGLSRGGRFAEKSGIGEPDNDDKLFLLVATGKDQSTINRNNVRFGALQTRDGQTEFFKLSSMAEITETERPLMLNVMLSSGFVGEEFMQQMPVAVKLDPLKEQALILEFAKATEVLNKNADERQAKVAQEASTIYKLANDSIMPHIHNFNQDHMLGLSALPKYQFQDKPDIREFMLRPSMFDQSRPELTPDQAPLEGEAPTEPDEA